MQSKFPSEYFVFLKSVGLVRRVTDCDAAVFRSASVLARLGCGRWGGPTRFLGFLTLPPPHPHFGLETWAICGFDAGGGRARVEDLRGALLRGEVSREEFRKKTRVARKPMRFLPPSTLTPRLLRRNFPGSPRTLTPVPSALSLPLPYA